MKKLNFTGDIAEVLEGLNILSERLNFVISDMGYEVKVTKAEGNLSVTLTENGAQIVFDKKHQFFRALGLLLEHLGENICLSEEPQFSTVGVMFDSSRNAVMTTDTFRYFIERMALMGYNLAMLYTEDTYEVKEYPYFGYMRGRYTYEELKACDDYGDIFGIEVIPCIQTLAHLRRTLRWNHEADIRDTYDVLLVGSEDTYKFVRTLMETASKPFRSKRIHLGLDEAHGIGFGSYLRRNGYTPASKLIREHTAKVMEIAKEMGLEPMMWADMYFRLKSTTGMYYTNLVGEFTEEDRKSVPENAQLVYWDYYKETNEEYRKLIRMHKQLSDNVIFAGSVWTFNRLVPSYRKTLATMIPAVEECISNGIKEAFLTMWGDDGNEDNILGSLYGLQLFAELSYGHKDDLKHVDERFFACTQGREEDFRALDLLDDFGQEEKASNASKSMLWQDPLLGLFDEHINIENIGMLYAERKKVLKTAGENSLVAKELFDFAYHVADVLELKAGLGIDLKRFYDEDNRSALHHICYDVLPETIDRVQKLRVSCRNLWFSVYKPFGFEEIERRFGGLVARLEGTQLRLEDYLNGKIQVIEELEEKRLPLNLPFYPGIEGLNFSELTYQDLMI